MHNRSHTVVKFLIYTAAIIWFDAAWLIVTGEWPSIWQSLFAVPFVVFVMWPLERALERRRARRDAERKTAA
ncbi:hypothetical protein [Streptomyces sp. NBC_01304]|uniref:hypothetical protein n=1 Tax=Streptomyces sp. NBC_01304 TaxID=2903818 RepID=UPI002E102569|nr:hypothetical protein OG430_48685 [Streptomyces sp. NBC_01304]